MLCSFNSPDDVHSGLFSNSSTLLRCVPSQTFDRQRNIAEPLPLDGEQPIDGKNSKRKKKCVDRRERCVSLLKPVCAVGIQSIAPAP